MAVLLQAPYSQFLDDDGNPLENGKVHTYVAGSFSQRKATYDSADETTELANPIILDASGRAEIWVSGSYNFTVTDENDTLVRNVENFTAYTIEDVDNEAYFESFSGDGSTVEFTLSEGLGTDEAGLLIFVDKGLNQYLDNRDFETDTIWTKGTGWTIGSGVATATGAISTAITQTAIDTLEEGHSYLVTMTITRSAGDLTVSIGGTDGTARNSSGTYTETIRAGSTQEIAFTGNGFTGTLDDVSVTKLSSEGRNVLFPTDFTINGTTLTFVNAPPDGSNNILVFAPSKILGAAGAAASLAEDYKDQAEAAAASITGLSGTSTTSLEIATGSKSFTTQSGLGFEAGQWVLATSDADPTNYMHGQVTSYSGTTLIVNVTNVGGSGTLADWTINVSGTRGAKGDTGAAGAGTGDLLAASNLSDVVSAATSFNNIKQDATTTATGVVELATQAEVNAGTDTSRAITPATLANYTGLSGGSWAEIEVIDISTQATADFENDVSSYDVVEFELINVVPVSDNQAFWMRTSTDGGSNYNQTFSFAQKAREPSGNDDADNNGQSQILLSGSSGVGSAAGESVCGKVTVYNPGGTEKTIIHYEIQGIEATTGYAFFISGSAVVATAENTDGFRFLFASGNLESGKIVQRARVSS